MPRRLALACAAVALGCADETTTKPPPAGTTPLGVFEPEGCAFGVAARPDYLGWALGQAVVGASPDVRRVRVGLGGSVTPGVAGHADPSTSVGVAWQTEDGTLVSDIAWGTDPDPAKWDPKDRASGVTWLTPAGTINPLGDSRMHEAYACGLTPDTTYHFRAGGGDAWSEVHRVKTAPAPGASEVRIILSGDSRGQENDAWRVLQRRAIAVDADLQLFSGDMVNLATDQEEWERWIDSAWKDDDGSLLSLGQLVTLATHGNHEAYTTLFFGNLVLPQEPAKYPKWGELFYSVDVGPVHVLVFDDFSVGSPELDPEYLGELEAWMRADLDKATANRSKVPWIVTLHHHAPFSSSNHGEDADVLRVRDFVVALFDEYHVDLDLAGHDHGYERTKPLTGPADDPTLQMSPADGTTYLVCAGAGADAYSSGTSAFTELSRDYKTGGAIGFYAVMTATAAELLVEAHELRPDGSDPVFDTIQITK